MGDVHTATTTSVEGPSSAAVERLARLRDLAASDPLTAGEEAFGWIRGMRSPTRHRELPWVFAQGSAPEAPNGDCEGVVMQLTGSMWLSGLDRLVRLGQLLGGIGWTGKTFDAAAGTGYNRLTSSSRLAALVAMPTYRFERINGELTGFPFYHSVQQSPAAPHGEVLAITYDAPEHHNPLVLPRTRDELVSVVPDVFLGRALLRDGDSWQVVGYFGLRAPRTGRS